MIDQIVDYAMPCMNAERELKKTHEAVLKNDFDSAIEAATRAAAECRLLVVTLKEMKERENALRKQAQTL